MGTIDVEGIPALIVLDKKGNIIEKDGRSVVEEKKAAAFANWVAKAKKV